MWIPIQDHLVYIGSRSYEITFSHNFTYPTIEEIPIGLPSFSGKMSSNISFAPVTIHNNWPNIKNQPLVSYLRENSEFGQFVRAWYKSSCAIIYRPFRGKGNIVGSGNLIAKNAVSTARHNYQSFPIHALYARFYNYKFFADSWVEESYIDVPIINFANNARELDSGKLTLLELPLELEKIFLRILPYNQEDLSPGDYAMFHFAGENQLVSTGHITPFGQWKNVLETISIQAGPGASGATIIWKGLSQTYGCATSIFRTLKNGTPERIVIPFSEWSHGGYFNSIKNPYLDAKNYYSSASDPFTEDGYERITWTKVYYDQANDVEKPDYLRFEYEPNVYDLPYLDFSNHHIIPKPDLLFLWDYFNYEREDLEIDPHTYATLQNQVDKKISSFIGRELEKAFIKIQKEYSLHSNTPFFKSERKLEIEQERDRKIYQERSRVFLELKKAHFAKKYANVWALIIKLSPKDKSGNVSRACFAWAWWNLFKGPEGRLRADDPKFDDRHRNEKNKPINFNNELWNYLQELYLCIHKLKNLFSSSGAADLEIEIEKLLRKIDTIWSKQTHHTIYSFNPKEWIQVFENGQSKYKIIGCPAKQAVYQPLTFKKNF